MYGCYRRCLREGLAQIPGALDFAQRRLQVAPRHVEADRIAVDQGVGTLRRDANAARTDGNDELDFVVVVFGGQRVLHMADIGRNDRHDRIRRLGEKERRLLGRIATHFPRVLRIVSPDAIDMAHGIEKGAACNRYRAGLLMPRLCTWRRPKMRCWRMWTEIAT